MGIGFSVFEALPDADAKGIQRAALYTVYGSDIAARLARIHAHPERDGPSGVLVVALHGRTPAYVRCVFADNGGTLLCEAVPGTYLPKPGAPPPSIPTATEAALNVAGYRRDPTGHAVFAYEISRDSGVWGGAAVVILTPLIDGFGARPGSKIDIVAPLAPERDEAAIQRELASQS